MRGCGKRKGREFVAYLLLIHKMLGRSLIRHLHLGRNQNQGRSHDKRVFGKTTVMGANMCESKVVGGWVCKKNLSTMVWIVLLWRVV